MLKIGFEPLQRLLDDGMDDLVQAHWEQVALDRDTIPLLPDYARMMAAEKVGRFCVISARKGMKIIGYNAFFVDKSMHYSSTTFAVNDVIFIDPDERSGGAGVRLIRKSEELLRGLVKEGEIIKVFYHTKVHVQSVRGTKVGDVLERLGYTLIEEIHAKTLRG